MDMVDKIRFAHIPTCILISKRNYDVIFFSETHTTPAFESKLTGIYLDVDVIYKVQDTSYLRIPILRRALLRLNLTMLSTRL